MRCGAKRCFVDPGAWLRRAGAGMMALRLDVQKFSTVGPEKIAHGFDLRRAIAEAPARESDMTGAEDNGVRLIRDFSEAWGRKDLAALAALLDEEAVYEASVGPEPGTTYRGKRAVLDGCQAMFAHDDGSRSETLAIYAAGEHGVCEWKYIWPGKGGAEASVWGCDLFTFRNGKILRKNAFRKVSAKAP